MANDDNNRMDDDAIDEEEDAQRRRSRSRKSSKEATNPALAYQLHPLKVVLHVYDTEDSGTKRRKLITLRFEYLAKLNVVCVGSEDSDGMDSNILCNLFPDDTGLELPHQVCFLEQLLFTCIPVVIEASGQQLCFCPFMSSQAAFSYHGFCLSFGSKKAVGHYDSILSLAFLHTI